jgi:hypothetical protein
VEVYTPIPPEVHPAPRAFQLVTTVVRVVVLVVAFAAVVRFAFEGPPADFRDFGAVRTQVGVAEVDCGGELTRCGETTALVFPTCSLDADWRVYFRMPDSRRPSDAEVDASVRRLVGARPPSGHLWDVTCRNGFPLGHHLAKLASD